MNNVNFISTLIYLNTEISSLNFINNPQTSVVIARVVQLMCNKFAPNHEYWENMYQELMRRS